MYMYAVVAECQQCTWNVKGPWHVCGYVKGTWPRNNFISWGFTGYLGGCGRCQEVNRRGMYQRANAIKLEHNLIEMSKGQYWMSAKMT